MVIRDDWMMTGGTTYYLGNLHISGLYNHFIIIMYNHLGVYNHPEIDYCGTYPRVNSTKNG